MRAVNVLEPAHEHEFEAAPGLPEALPPGERQLWQGSPDARLIARQALHINKVAAYFGLLLAWKFGTGLYDGLGLGGALGACVGMLPPIALALGLLAGMAWLIARTSVYTLTSERLVMRIGIVLSITFNLPLRRIASAALCKRAGGGGDITLQLAEGDRIAYPHLWPHARPWQLRQPQPMLRALRDADVVAAQLVQALSDAQSSTALPLQAIALPAGLQTA